MLIREHMHTIMMTDIIGFTGLTRQKKEEIGKLSRRHARLIGDSVAMHGGRVVNIFGDSALALFDFPLSALNCAVEIQKESSMHPAIPMRIALHCGEIIAEGNEVYGDAINLTARILKVAQQGNVLCSDDLHGILSPDAGFTLRSAGIFNLKYVERPVEIYGIDHQGLTFPLLEPGDREISVHSSSVAVMPFLNLGASAENQFLGEGVSEAIIHALSKLEGISIISRSSSFAFSKQHKDMKDAGRLLGVAHVLEGSVQQYENKIRITAQLINTGTGFHEFSETYDKELRDFFSIQEEIAWLIAWRLKQELSQREKMHMAIPRTSSTRALEYTFQARHLMAHPGKEDILGAIEMFKRAIEEDPGFVLPYSGISICYLYLGVLKYIPEEESYQKSEEYSRRAIQIDPELPEAMVVYALSSFWVNNWNLASGQQVVSEALRVAPGSAEIRLFKGMFDLMSGNKKDALVEIMLANKLDPLNPNILSRLAYTCLCLEDYEQAHTYFRLAHNTAPFAMYINYIQAWSYLLQGQYERAESALKDVDSQKDVYQSVCGTQGFLDARLGRAERAYEQIRQIKLLEEKGAIAFPNYNCSLVYAGLNKVDEMFACLERAFTEKPVHLMFIQADPFWNPYRSDQRYVRMVNRVFKRSPSSGPIVLHAATRERLKLNVDDILYIAAEDNYSRVVWTDGTKRREKVLRSTLKQMEEQLTGMDMLRCHRSYLVNCSRYALEGDSRGYKLSSGADPEILPVSRAYSRKIIERLT
jgi:adenylate cyclase